MNDLRVVIDTNIIVRAISGRSLTSFVFDSLFNQAFTLCVSTEILFEYEEKLSQIYDQEIAELVTSSFLLLPNIHKSDIYFDLRLVSKDVDDNKFINCAFSSNSHFIVSDDKHFNVLASIDFPKINVLKYHQFKDLLINKSF
ncbi:MAG: putative toxin-antitoxin system toxin component, PIN family [Saprospiraceae bacterium]